MALPTSVNAQKPSAFSMMSAFLRKHAKFYVIYLNFLAIISILYLLLAPVLFVNLDELAREATLIQIGSALFYSFLILLYPVFFQKAGALKNPLRFLTAAFIVKIVITTSLQLLGVFPGYNNFVTDYEYGRDYLYGKLLDQPGYESDFYYPPGCSLFFVFLYIINPGENALVFRLQMLFFDFGTSWLILKIAQIKSLGMSTNSTMNALLFYTFSAIQVFTLILYQKFDVFIIFLSIAGIYCLFEKKWFLSTFILVFCGFFKVYTFLWLAGILLYLLKMKQWQPFKKFLLSTIIAGLTQVSIFSLIEGFEFFENLLKFGWHFTIWEEAYNLNWSYYLKYLNIPFLNFLPPILIIAAFLYYVIFHVKQVDLKFFINTILILLILYPSVNYHYMIWIIPLIGLNMMGDSARYRRGLLAYDVIHVNVDQHVFAWLLAFGFGGYMVVKNPMGDGTLVVLIARFLIVITMLIGLFIFINWEKRGGLGPIQFQVDSQRQSTKTKPQHDEHNRDA